MTIRNILIFLSIGKTIGKTIGLKMFGVKMIGKTFGLKLFGLMTIGFLACNKQIDNNNIYQVNIPATIPSATSTAIENPIIVNDKLAHDSKAAAYRTGLMDERISQIPQSLNDSVFNDPESYLPELVAFLIADSDDSYLIVKRIHDWITLNIAYDNNLLMGTAEGSRQTYSLLRLRRTTCGGYANLFGEMAKLAGLETSYVSGISRNYYSQTKNEEGSHAWNLVKIDTTWYIVDTTHDGRIVYEDGTFSDLDEYSDLELFIHPQAKAWINIPNQVEQQLLAEPVSMQDFLARPRYKLGYIKYDINFISPIQSLRQEYEISHQDSSIVKTYDIIRIQQSLLQVSLQNPNDVKILCKLQDENGFDLQSYSFTYLDEHQDALPGKSISVCQWSYPDDKPYIASIYAKHLNTNDSYELIYRFYFQGQQDSGVLLPLENIVYKTAYAQTFDLEVISHNLDQAANSSYYWIEIGYDSDVEISASLKDELNQSHDEFEYLSYPSSNSKKYIFAKPNQGIYFVKVFAALRCGEINIDLNNELIASQNNAALDCQNENTKETVILFKIVSDKKEGSSEIVLPPAGELYYRLDFHAHGYSIVSDNISQVSSDAIYKVNIQSPSSRKLVCRLRDMQLNDIDYHFAYHRDASNLYSCFFSAPLGSYMAKIYEIDDQNENWQTVAEFRIENFIRKGQALPEIGRLYLRNEFYDLGLQIMDSKLDLCSDAQSCLIDVSYSDGMDCGANLRDQAGNKYPDLSSSVSLGENSKRFIFFASNQWRLEGRIFCKNDQVDNFPWRVAEFAIDKQR